MLRSGGLLSLLQVYRTRFEDGLAEHLGDGAPNEAYKGPKSSTERVLVVGRVRPPANENSGSKRAYPDRVLNASSPLSGGPVRTMARYLSRRHQTICLYVCVCQLNVTVRESIDPMCSKKLSAECFR